MLGCSLVVAPVNIVVKAIMLGCGMAVALVNIILTSLMPTLVANIANADSCCGLQCGTDAYMHVASHKPAQAHATASYMY